MDIDVKRNKYGRQKDSFEATIEIFDQKYLGVFIRAPSLASYYESKDDIKVLSKLDGEIIAIQQGNNIAMSFHPELTDDTLVHEYFIKNILDSVNEY
jgi:5'-phosphate synthase pdxT subunit